MGNYFLGLIVICAFSVALNVNLLTSKGETSNIEKVIYIISCDDQLKEEVFEHFERSSHGEMYASKSGVATDLSKFKECQVVTRSYLTVIKDEGTEYESVMNKISEKKSIYSNPDYTIPISL
jgi:hypothetical protein